jgi:hypothetical protein
LVGKPERKRPLEIPQRRWEDDIKMNFRNIEWGDMNCTDLAQSRDKWMSLVKNTNESSGSTECWEILE